MSRIARLINEHQRLFDPGPDDDPKNIPLKEVYCEDDLPWGEEEEE